MIEDWKRCAVRRDGFYDLETEDLGGVRVRLFVTKALFDEAEPTLYRQIVNAARFRDAGCGCSVPSRRAIPALLLAPLALALRRRRRRV